MEGEERRGEAEEEQGGIWVEEKANFSVITLPRARWGARARRLPKGKLCDCVYV